MYQLHNMWLFSVANKCSPHLTAGGPRTPVDYHIWNCWVMLRVYVQEAQNWSGLTLCTSTLEFRGDISDVIRWLDKITFDLPTPNSLILATATNILQWLENDFPFAVFQNASQQEMVIVRHAQFLVHAVQCVHFKEWSSPLWSSPSIVVKSFHCQVQGNICWLCIIRWKTKILTEALSATTRQMVMVIVTSLCCEVEVSVYS